MKLYIKTRATLNGIKDDFERFIYWVTVIVSLIFLFLYVFKIATNIYSPVYCVIYSILLTISAIGFGFFLMTFNDRMKKSVVLTKRTIRISKYAANGIMVLVITVQFLQQGADAADTLISVISVVAFLIQILIEIIREIFERYIEMLKYAITRDSEWLQKDMVEHFLDGVKAPFDVVNDLKNAVDHNIPIPTVHELTSAEKRVEELAKEFEKQDAHFKRVKHKNKRSEVKHSMKRAVGALGHLMLKPFKRTVRKR